MDSKILAIIPARSGSKRVKNKNFKTFADTTLLDLAIISSIQSKKIEKIIVSSDSTHAKIISSKYEGLEFIKRPKKISTDKSLAIEYILHSITELEKKNEIFDLVVIIQPTSPFRTGYDIDSTIDLLEKNPEADSSVSIVKINHMYHPHKIKKLNGLKLNPWKIEEGKKTSEHEIPELYVRNCAVYVFKVSNLKKHITYGKNCLGYLMGPESAIDINTTTDFHFAEYLYLNKTI